jgi:hypothetical protein
MGVCVVPKLATFIHWIMLALARITMQSLGVKEKAQRVVENPHWLRRAAAGINTGRGFPVGGLRRA